MRNFNLLIENPVNEIFKIVDGKYAKYFDS